MNRRLLRIACVLLAALSVPAASIAQQGLQSYEVELVIFRTLSAGGSPEQWSLEAADAGQGLAIPEEDTPFAAATPAPAATANFPALPAAKYKLTAIEEGLRRSRNYQPLAHVGWTQPGYPRDGARFIAVNSLAPDAANLSGQIALSRGRYLHLTLDLTVTGEDGQRYVLRQTRRMRSNERHYIDHPKFGVIAVVTPSS